jgi:two-component system, chemotaxis family, sensor kinase CheA
MNDFLQQFLIESREIIAQAADGLQVLEKNSRDADTLDTVFRAFHTLKGGAGIVEFAAMETTLHSTETLLQDVRAGKRTLDADLIGDCFASLDQVSSWLDTLEITGELPVVDVRAEITAVGAASQRAQEFASSDWMSDLLGRYPGAIAHAASVFRFTPDADCFYKGEDPIAYASSLSRLLALDIEPAMPWPALHEFDPYACNIVLSGLTAARSDEVTLHFQRLSGDLQACALDSKNAATSGFTLPDTARRVLQEQLAILEITEDSAAGRLGSVGLTAANVLRFCGLLESAEALTRTLREATAQNLRRVLQAAIAQLVSLKMPAASPATAAQTAAATPGTAARTLRVNAEHIDALVRLTGELTIEKNAIGHTAQLSRDRGDFAGNLLKAHHSTLDRLISQLQKSVIGMRVLPLRSVFQRFPRALREMSLNLGKPAQIKIDGEDTEADKTIVEMLFEPLLHVVRNAVDHGIEDIEHRRLAGKPPVATITLRAVRDGDQVLITVSDDGAGIDVERIRQVAKDRGVASEEDLRGMSDSAVMDLVFVPGLSTASSITEISGRGVGMDAVRAAVERIGGRVSIASRPTQGTTVSFLLPFSVLMTQVMVVEAGGQAFGIPLDAVMETLLVAQGAISGVGEGRVIVQRNRTIPIVDLGSVLHVVQEKRARDSSEVTVIITAIADQLVGLQVERVGERMEVVLKPLEGLLAGTPGIAGTTLLGDGRVLLVLDILGILQ